MSSQDLIDTGVSQDLQDNVLEDTSKTPGPEEALQSQNEVVASEEAKESSTESKPSVKESANESKPPTLEENLSPNETVLRDAFPTMDISLIRAVLVASRGDLEAAFIALLSMSDPTFNNPQGSDEAAQRQLEEDERIARQLAEEDQAQQRQRQLKRQQQRELQQKSEAVAEGYSGRFDDTSRRYETTRTSYDFDGETGRPSYSDGDNNGVFTTRSFMDEDLPQIKETLQKGFVETRTKVNNWVKNFQKRLDTLDTSQQGMMTPGNFLSVLGVGNNNNNEDSQETTATKGVPGHENRNTEAREVLHTSTRNTIPLRDPRFDDDPVEISQNFECIQLQIDDGNDEDSEEDELAKKKSETRKIAPGISTPHTKAETSSTVVTAKSPTTLSKSGSSTSLNAESKWEPLRAVEPKDDQDAFFLGDSDSDEDKN
ncbi:hypothetical protein NADFUDRAFT_42414 [Nadsonia fulvescens var. elongata DSM 6958]|uniref:CUE domain-containing protein n=1 Tax=Nadsonia fulvescens var. elongata DSM 6958 TaxID=857566 RepID=A0A1E3PI80_9ASCO|nr:hypothetical protein NADFUDRAFT_42414 [Nadsonia fulvescens var. elongata DSM 6958]